eukprot:gene19097-biopygen156
MLLDLRGCGAVRAPDGAAGLACVALHACRGAAIPLGDCHPHAPCALTCGGKYACAWLNVRTNGTCVRPAACADDYACSGLDLRGCATVSTPVGVMGPGCIGKRACKEAILPLGECQSSNCGLMCNATQACQGLVVRTNGTCLRPFACGEMFACRRLDMRGCAAVRVPEYHHLMCAGVSSCEDAAMPLGPCPATAPCEVLCGQERACRGLTVSSSGVCVRQQLCAHPAGCAGLDMRRCGRVGVLPGMVQLACTAKDACKHAAIPLGGCDLVDMRGGAHQHPCPVTCDAEGACDGLKATTDGTCVRPAECRHRRACAGLQLRCGAVEAPGRAPGLLCAAESACEGAAIPLGECAEGAACAVRCDAERACDRLNVSTPGVCVRPSECGYDSACAALSLHGCGTVRAPHAAPHLRCSGVSACNGSFIPLGACPPSVACALTCSSGEGACCGMKVSTPGTCVRPSQCAGDSVCSHLLLLCGEMR